MRKEKDYFPVVVASPSEAKVKDKEYIDEEEDLEMDYDRLYYGGKMEYIKKNVKPFFHKNWGYEKKQKIVHMRRGQLQAQIQRKAELW